MAETWMQAHRRHAALVAAHPLFPALVHAVGAERAAGHPRYQYLRMNSPTYGSWIFRDARGVNQGVNRTLMNPRAVRLARRMQEDLALLPTLPPSEGEALIRGVAREWVDARRAPR